MNEVVSIELVNKYLQLTDRARQKATSLVSQGSREESLLKDMMSMSDDYRSDAEHFRDNGDLVRAFGAINYAHAWIDCAVKTGLLDGHDDDTMFTLP